MAERNQSVVPFAVVKPAKPGMSRGQLQVPTGGARQRVYVDVNDDELVALVSSLTGSSPLDPLLRQMAEELAHMRVAREACVPESPEYADIATRRVRSLKTFYDLFERRVWKGATLNPRSEGLRPILEVWVERLRQAMTLEGLDPTRESSLLQRFSRCLEGWEDEAERRMGGTTSRGKGQ